MTHLTEEQLTLAYYGDIDPELLHHLDECTECRSQLNRLEDLLDAIRDYPVPQREASYGGDVWVRLLPKLPVAKARRSWLRWWMAVPALASLLMAVFVAGMLVQHRREPSGISLEARQRVLLSVMSDHLDRSQILLAQLVNASPADIDVGEERARARDLVTENRLLRQTAALSGDVSHSALLDEIERVLLEVANTPPDSSPVDLEALQRRVAIEGLLFKVRIVGANLREKEQRL
jgi:hypothetical protein